MTRDSALVDRLAKLARLALTDDERKRYAKEFQEIVEYVGLVERVRAESRPLTSTITGVRHVLRADEVVPSDRADVLLAQAPAVERRGVKAPPAFPQ